MNTNEARDTFQTANVVELIDDVLTELEALCRKRGVSVKFVGRGDHPPAMVCRERLRRLSRLLLARVIETAKPRAEVEILLRRVHASLLVCVRDQLPGAAKLPPEAPLMSSGRSEGTGFCCDDPDDKLAECREIVAGQGGEIWAWKTLAGGTVVCFDLPIGAAAASEDNESAPVAACSTFVAAPADSCLTSN